MADLYIPRKTEEALSTPYAPGTRHKAAIDIALPLIGNGMAAESVFQTLQTKFHPGLSEKELRDIVNWAQTRGQPASMPDRAPMRRPTYNPPPLPKPKPPAEHAQWWLGGLEMTVEQFTELSQLPIPENKVHACSLALEMLWEGAENLNIVCQYIEEDGKARPHGPGRILSRDKWLEYLKEKGVPESKAGAWFRPNPCQAQGSGTAGAVTDSDIVAWKYLLLESDVLPLPMQLALFAKLKIPIVAVTMSGGISGHAWVNLGCKSANEFAQIAKRLLTALAPFGIDQANKNPSRLSRLPCATRTIGAINGGLQQLLWLNPGRQPIQQRDLEMLEDALQIPAVEEKPFKRVITEAIDRYDYLLTNRGKLGVPTGFPTLQKAMGGWKPATMSVIAAYTGGGKTTLAINLMNTALTDKVGVALFSMEMTKEDICDMLFALNAKIDRNHFNTGEFTEAELKCMTNAALWMKDLPLWLNDSSTLTVEQIRKETLQLKAENRIGLVIIDYAQLVTPERDADTRELQVAAISRSLRVLAKDAQLPLIVLSQLNDEGKIRESRVLSHEASNVFVLEKRDNDDNKMRLHVTKGRKIKSHPIDIYFNAEYCQMAEMETRL